MKKELHNLFLILVPMQYQLITHDDGARQLLDRIDTRVVCQSFSSPAHRQINVVQQIVLNVSFDEGQLRKELAEVVPEILPSTGLQSTGNDTLHRTFRHIWTVHAFWVNTCHTTIVPLPSKRPLDQLFHDIVQMGCGIIHGYLAVFQCQGVLLADPPGDGKFLISPRPTWSALFGINPLLDRITQWQGASSHPLQTTLFLEKACATGLLRQRPINAAFPFYLALSKSPTLVMGRNLLRVAIFRVAASQARKGPAWTLHLPRRTDFWCCLAEESASAC